MTAIYPKYNFRWKPCLVGLAYSLLAACAHNSTQTAPIDSVRQQVERAPTGSSESAPTPLDINQISSASKNFEAPQISRNVDVDQLSIDQLKAYADRCAPGSTLPQGGIDCSELSLRVKKVFRSDDLVRDALITLDRLGRDGTKGSPQIELGQSNGILSLSAQGIANGILEAPAPAIEPPEAPNVDNIDSILNQLGLGQNAGAIIESGG